MRKMVVGRKCEGEERKKGKGQGRMEREPKRINTVKREI